MTAIRRIRWYQEPLVTALQTGIKRVIAVCHRRWGKDEIALDWTADAIKHEPGNYWHCLPEYAQARKAIWTSVNAHTGQRRIDEAFPKHWRESTNEGEMFIRFRNGSTWQLIGSDRYNNLVGSGVRGVVFSEWAIANPSAWGYIRPIIEENGGWALFITTPRGRNHAYAMFEMAKRNPHWFAHYAPITATEALSYEQLEESRTELITLYGRDLGIAQYEQEYLCNWNAAILGAFYALEMRELKEQNRVRIDVEPEPGYPIHTAWDLGVRDSTAIWWFQPLPQPRILDYYAAHGHSVDHYAKEVLGRKWDRKGAVDFVPHDARVREWGVPRTRVESMFEYELNPSVVPISRDADGHQAIRSTLPRCVFHTRCEDGIAALENYRREWDDDLKTFKPTALHDWASHGAKAFQYLAQAWQAMDPPPEPKPELIAKSLNELTFDEFFEIEDNPNKRDRI
jgi:phage terminase large subunit